MFSQQSVADCISCEPVGHFVLTPLVHGQGFT